MTQHEIEAAAADVMGRFIGQEINEHIFAEIADAIEDATGCAVLCSRANNPQWQTDHGEVQAEVQAPSPFIIRIDAEDFYQPPVQH